LVFQDQYIQFVLGVPSKVGATYGFGESTRHSQQLTYNSTYTLWNTDQGASNFDQSLYGSHPFYIQVAADGKAHGVLFLNTNGMEVTVTESASQGNTIGVQSTGGLIDIYVFAGPTPGDVVRQYLEVVGKPAMVPYWALGFHNCRWGYENIDYVEEVVANYSAAKIPLETQWTDIDYMDGFKDFTFSPQNFPLDRMQTFVKNLHAAGQRYVPIVDPAIYVQNSTYSAYTEGMKMDVFVKDMYGKEPYLSQVWPGPTYFPDWFAPNAQAYWSGQMKDFFDAIEFDGIWIDMNEASNFCNADGNGQVCELMPEPCDRSCGCIQCKTVDASNKYDYPPYVPNLVWGALGAKTMPASAVHAGGVLEYNAHNLYGLMESIATRQALLDIRPAERPFVLSRSTSMGSGKYTAHWTGDNAATWDDLKASITTMNNLALFGMSVTGADICGFNGATWEELCARWIEVGAFSPFSRDHNAIGQPPQELYRWDTVAEASRKALSLRYQLLPYLYTLTYNAHANGDLLMCGLWVNFPSDPITLTQDSQYMWSDGLLFTPVLASGATSVTGYFPKGVWYSLTDDSVIDTSAIGAYVELPTDLTSTNVHVRGGRVIPMQGAAMTTTAARATPFTLLIALDKDGQAHGSLYLDDGKQDALTHSTTVAYTANNGVLTSTVGLNTYTTDALVGTVEVRGVRYNRHARAVPTCSATLSSLSDKLAVEMVPASVQFAQHEEYASVIFSFGAAQAVKVASNFELNWKCM
jgi:alpha-glucosidase (family GH31 glycosyl hydrolase)